MIKIDLITGFLGAGKTTFILKYAKYLLNKGYKIGVVENDYSPINVDALLLDELNNDNCLIEQVVGGYNLDDYKRRLKAKLIAFKMQNVNRVIIEPSGLFDIDTLFDVINDDLSLSSWYMINNIISVVDLSNIDNLNKEEEYIFVSQLIASGNVIYTHLDKLNKNEIDLNINKIKSLLKKYKSNKKIDVVSIYKNVDLLNNNDMILIENSSYSIIDIDHQNLNLNRYDSFFILDSNIKIEELKNIINTINSGASYGHIIRIKGFINDDGYKSINYSNDELIINKVNKGQDVIIFIGINLNEDKIKELFKND